MRAACGGVRRPSLPIIYREEPLAVEATQILARIQDFKGYSFHFLSKVG